MWLVSLTSETFEELYDTLGYILNDEKKDKYIRKVIIMCSDNFILYECKKDKSEELVEFERRRNNTENIEIVTNMLKENMKISLISKTTALREKEIMKIKESL